MLQAAWRLYAGSLERARRALAARELAALDWAIAVEPTDALLQCLQRAAGQAAWLRCKVESLTDEKIVSLGAHGTPVPHIWIRMEQEALDRVARFSRMALEAGVAERSVRIAERSGQLIAAALDDVIGPLDLAPVERVALVERFGTRLEVLEQTPEAARG